MPGWGGGAHLRHRHHHWRYRPGGSTNLRERDDKPAVKTFLPAAKLWSDFSAHNDPFRSVHTKPAPQRRVRRFRPRRRPGDAAHDLEGVWVQSGVVERGGGQGPSGLAVSFCRGGMGATVGKALAAKDADAGVMLSGLECA
ncbi:hypothetical protein MVEN_00154900 [Mycena venus]|uniref:Uncharacterized protein n=1 Tax=Mycena venus TaxID=2733690 RepID=A0A8H7DBH3_9AGAR|nr:hypothetical protein MVEN_00154900 [Mycena venus]